MASKWLGRLTGWLVVLACALPGPAVVEAQDPESAPVVDEDLPSRPADAFWVRTEYLLWTLKSPSLPPLVGTIPIEAADAIHTFPSSTITPLLGGPAGGIDYGARSGLRIEGGLWLDCRFGVEAGFFQLASARRQALFASPAAEPLGPLFFTDPTAGQEILVMEAVPGLRAGTMLVQADSRLWGAEANGLYRLDPPGWLDRLDLLAGFRHLQLSEGLTVAGTSQAIPGGRLPCG
jgi:hypothetical protein